MTCINACLLLVLLGVNVDLNKPLCLHILLQADVAFFNNGSSEAPRNGGDGQRRVSDASATMPPVMRATSKDGDTGRSTGSMQTDIPGSKQTGVVSAATTENGS